MKTVTKKQVLEWLSEVFQTAPGELSESSTKASLAAWDSMAMLVLIAELDEKLQVVLSDDELSSVSSVGDILALLREKQVEITE